MSHPLLSAFASRDRGAVPSRVSRPPAWAARPEAAGPEIAVLLTGCCDAAAAVRGYRTVLPRAQVWLYDSGVSPDERAAAEAAGAGVRSVPPSPRDALVRRMLAEVDADIYILAHAASADDVCVAPLIVAEIEAGRDLVDVRRFGGIPSGDAGTRLLERTVDFAFGGWGHILHSDFKACSRRFALSYRRTAPRDGFGDACARDLALHALRLRLPVGEVVALGAERPLAGPATPHGPAGWASVLAVVVRLLVEERPRRVFGLLGLAVMALGIAVAVPELKIHHWRAILLPGSRTLAALAMLAAGTALGAAGVLLDTLASARQEVRRLGVAAIPRRADRVAP